MALNNLYEEGLLILLGLGIDNKKLLNLLDSHKIKIHYWNVNPKLDIYLEEKKKVMKRTSGLI